MVLENIGNQFLFKINTTDKSRRFNQYFDMFLFGILYIWGPSIKDVRIKGGGGGGLAKCRQLEGGW